ncbi:hypothetical protein F5B22DRAFT_361985 [Xylaria bambusicola]|uniref:uncharacterized protein n=1 Tax=Xylaria bambusicola TaxID=326684 RepID=UPI002008AD37|nr:uncharacterized protein F5B22DRAFT_361985 [Xylaria bambusicola]KAI0509351.1 hypothetical protein F5B22DRAFT_361985 [Xylaria bambusicola]
MSPLVHTSDGASISLPRLRYPIPIHDTPETLGPRALVGADTVPQGYGNAPFGPEPGTVAGIVLGAVAGFLLLLGLVYWCINIGQGPRMVEEGSVGGGSASVVSWHSRPRGPPRRHHRRSRHSPRHETVEIRRERERVVPVRVEHEDQIVVEEFQSRSRSRSRPMSRGPPPPRSVLSEGDDMIVVEEDRTPPRRRRDSMRSQRTRSPYREDIYVRDVSRRRSGSRA